MLSFLWPLFLVIISSTVYNICAKSTPQNIQPFASLALTYLVSAGLSLILFFVFSEEKHLMAELSKANWATYLLGFALVVIFSAMMMRTGGYDPMESIFNGWGKGRQSSMADKLEYQPDHPDANVWDQMENKK